MSVVPFPGTRAQANPPAKLERAWARVGALGRWAKEHVSDEWCVALVATSLSIAAYGWSHSQGLTTAFNDAQVRQLIARRVLIGRTPGVAQLGATWLPLPSILMLPFVWNNTLFRDGLAGSIRSMASYVVASVYMYRIARLATSSRTGGWVAAGVLMFNPSLLYMQSTAMSETASLGAFVAAVYYAMRLARTHQPAEIVKCATAAAAGTLIRYDDWVAAIVILPVLMWIGWRRGGYQLAEAWAVLYGLLAFAGCAAWVIYNAVIFHDPLISFFYGQSSHTYYANTPGRLLPGRGHPIVAFKMYGLTVAGTVGWVLLLLAAAGLAIALARSHLASLPMYLCLVPFAFYWLVLYLGVNTESLPQLGMGSYYNIRFGLSMIPAVALCVAVLTAAGPVRRRGLLAATVLVPVAIIGLLGSTQQTAFVLREAIYGDAGLRQAGQAEAQWFAREYRGGNILLTYVNNSGMAFYLLTKYRLPDRAFVTDANGPQFIRTLAHPEDSVKWIVMNSDSRDGPSRVWAALHQRTAWQQYFILQHTFGTTQVYEKA
jgi:hypothetical protein